MIDVDVDVELVVRAMRHKHDERLYTKLLKKLHWETVNQHGANTESQLI